VLAIILHIRSKLHEAWLQTPEGMKWQEADRARQREAERRRKEAEALAAKERWLRCYASKTLDEIATMTGRQFEEFLACLFARMGYCRPMLTAVNDQGADILCLSPSGAKVAIQAKRWRGSVGNEAVQQLLGAMVYYECVEGIVVTNSQFTQAARALARKDPRITLCDRRWLAEQITRFVAPEKAEADRRQAAQQQRDEERRRSEAEHLREEQDRIRRDAEQAAERHRQQKDAERLRQEQERTQRDADQAKERFRERLEAARIEQEQERVRRDAERAVEQKCQRQEIQPSVQPEAGSDEQDEEEEQESTLDRVHRLKELYRHRTSPGAQDPVLRPDDELRPLVELGDHWGFLTYSHVGDFLRVRVIRIEPDGPLKIQPDDTENRQRLGRLLSALENRDLVLGAFNEMEDAPGHDEWEAHQSYEKGNVRFELGEYDEAFQEFDYAVSVDPAYALLLTPKYERAHRESETLAKAWEELNTQWPLSRFPRQPRPDQDDDDEVTSEVPRQPRQHRGGNDEQMGDEVTSDWDSESLPAWDNVIRAYEEDR
jgi:hypothetical protein